ncbi:hypothetical protein [Desulfosporosinus sp. FKB]|uniref:hypothetical protein n=1 Tax=Desulfosporosinus sp. FKB TaxID=1969835 RepID=UPI000B4A48AC|nr:hypothetical protein [Desulfosporosinus sp. FKB]
MTSLAFVKDGKMLSSTENGGLTYTSFTCTKDKVINKQEKTASNYIIKDINGSTYMFFEWKSGDYIFRNMPSSYYVLKKVDNKDYSNYQVEQITHDKIDYPLVGYRDSGKSCCFLDSDNFSGLVFYKTLINLIRINKAR